MRFGEKIRELRLAKALGQRALAERVGTSFTYISKIENEKLDFGDYPSEAMIHKLAEALDADEDELLVLAQKIAETIKRRVLQWPDAFRTFATCDDETLGCVQVPVLSVRTPQVAPFSSRPSRLPRRMAPSPNWPRMASTAWSRACRRLPRSASNRSP
jgi:transcriptional regulator with XRE-family HTH domain